MSIAARSALADANQQQHAELARLRARAGQHIARAVIAEAEVERLRALLAAAPAPTDECPLCGHKPHPRPCEHHIGDGCPTSPAPTEAGDE